MRFFFRISENVQPLVPLMLMVLRHPAFQGSDGPGNLILRANMQDAPEMKEIDGVKRAVIGLMQLVGGAALGTVVAQRLEPSQKLEMTANGMDRFLMILNSKQGALFCCGDETITMASNEVWWCGHAALRVSNNSKDDLFFLSVEIALDR